MKLICSVFDVKAKLWSIPFFSHSSVVAMRDFAAAAKGEGGIAQFPDDYQLWSIGTWDECTGAITPFEPNFLATGSDFTKEA